MSDQQHLHPITSELNKSPSSNVTFEEDAKNTTKDKDNRNQKRKTDSMKLGEEEGDSFGEKSRLHSFNRY